MALGAAARPAARGKGMERLKAGCEALGARREALPALAAEAWGLPQREELARLVGEAERRYGEACGAVRGLDFDRLLTATRDLLAGNPAILVELRRPPQGPAGRRVPGRQRRAAGHLRAADRAGATACPTAPSRWRSAT